jgi:hypothetical protein
MKKDGPAVALAEFTEHTLQLTCGSQQMSRPQLSTQSSLLLDSEESQRVIEISGQGLDSFDLLGLPSLTESRKKLAGLGFVCGLPNVSR